MQFRCRQDRVKQFHVELGPIAELADSLSIRRNGSRITLRIRYDAGELMEHVTALMDDDEWDDEDDDDEDDDEWDDYEWDDDDDRQSDHRRDRRRSERKKKRSRDS